MPYEPPPYLASLTLAEIAELVATRKLPPVEGWAPHWAHPARWAPFTLVTNRDR